MSIIEFKSIRKNGFYPTRKKMVIACPICGRMLRSNAHDAYDAYATMHMREYRCKHNHYILNVGHQLYMENWTFGNKYGHYWFFNKYTHDEASGNINSLFLIKLNSNKLFNEIYDVNGNLLKDIISLPIRVTPSNSLNVEELKGIILFS